ncbi:hypothetical protein SDC9_153617 [bioreactor metagenome]|uniref:Uncharacterized protein n=1 Tax=bioreactor metagenome TaxID=1076179 RepID=A0A645EWE5_9ZZZZ
MISVPLMFMLRFANWYKIWSIEGDINLLISLGAPGWVIEKIRGGDVLDVDTLDDLDFIFSGCML